MRNQKANTMPVEIRELVIKTEIVSSDEQIDGNLTDEQLYALKQQIIQECLKQLRSKQRNRTLER